MGSVEERGEEPVVRGELLGAYWLEAAGDALGECRWCRQELDAHPPHAADGTGARGLGLRVVMVGAAALTIVAALVSLVRG
ncbi:hypothetical protein [Streptomyces sp. NPDC059063]|uniref:hypothetical protein n=1 Tax=unclassified Streptomyces TaxID=2593676 RepID=UPI0036955361